MLINISECGLLSFAKAKFVFWYEGGALFINFFLCQFLVFFCFFVFLLYFFVTSVPLIFIFRQECHMHLFFQGCSGSAAS